MMDFQGIADLLLSYCTGAASVTVSFSSLSPALAPVLAIVFFVTTLPRIAILTPHIFGLPFTHTGTAAKVTFVNLRVTSSEPLAAPIAIYYSAADSAMHKTAFHTTSNRFGFIQTTISVLFGVKHFAANGASDSSFLLSAVLACAPPVTKPPAGFVVIHAAALALYIGFAIGTLDDYMIFKHTQLYHILRRKCRAIAAENLSRQARLVEIAPAYCAVILQRYLDAFGIRGELIP